MIALDRDSDTQRISQKELRALWANRPGELAGIKRAGISTPSGAVFIDPKTTTLRTPSGVLCVTAG
jgi:hypothetical protein